MCDLKSLLEQCQRDTLEILGDVVAGRLASWQAYEQDSPRLVQFVHDRIHADTWKNGATLEKNKRLSLERIVIQCGREMFTAEDVERAKATLNMSDFV